MRQLENSEYAVGWISALPHERTAAEAMLDEKHAPPQHKHQNDHNIYTLGSINGPNSGHNVVIASLPLGRYGTTSAGTAAAQLLSSFPQIKFGLMVGIGGGISNRDNDIRLGDVVVSQPEGAFGGVRQYAYGKVTVHGFEERGSVNSPPRVLLNAVGVLQSRHELTGSLIPDILETMRRSFPLMAKPRQGPGYIYQGVKHDRLFHSAYEHPSGKESCIDCDSVMQVTREERSDHDPYIHYGTIASGDKVIKDARIRDRFLDCLCFETEAAGLMNDFPCLVIRGISDYCDSHKNDQWQRYAAATAAAYAKELLAITDVGKILKTPEARAMMAELHDIKSATNEIAESLNLQNLDRQRQDLYQWLSPLDSSARHNENSRKRVKDTGLWFLKDPKFHSWCSKTAQSRTLCCYGDPGAGKTIMSSLVIDYLQEHIAKKSKFGLSYLYCDYRDQKQYTAENVLGMILRQLLRLLPEIPKVVLNRYQERNAENKPMDLSDANDLLNSICAQFNQVYICLDALDELGPNMLRSLLKSIRDGPSIQIFLTGRPYVQENVREYFDDNYTISVEAQDNDIRLYIESEIGGPNDVAPKAMDHQLRMDIVAKVVKSAQGIFLLPTLQVRAVLQAITIRDREESLKRLPSNLSEAFAGTMTRIRQQPDALSELARKVIVWIHLAERSLVIEELLCALAIKDRDTSFDPRGEPDQETLLHCCHGLVIIDQETSTVRLVHYSLQEYLSGDKQLFGVDKSRWQSRIATICLILLSFPSREDEERQWLIYTKLALLDYAATQWGHHLRKSDKSLSTAFELAKAYLRTTWRDSSASLRLLYKVMYSNEYYEGREQHHVLAPHITAYFGLEDIMLHLGRTGLNLDSQDVVDRTSLSWGAASANETVVKILIEKGAVVDSVDKYGMTPLSWAAKHGHAVVAKLLIEKGAAVDAMVQGYCWTPLSLAARNEHKGVVEALLERGAAVNLVDSYSRTPLFWAAEYGHKAVVKMLIKNQATVDSKDKYGETSLSRAAKHGYGAVVKILIEKGATVDPVENRYGRTPLSWAAEHGNEAVVEILTAKGAEVDSVDKHYGQTPLSWAAKNGHHTVMNMLIEKGAAVNSADKIGQTPLSWAAENGLEAVTKMLIEKGAVVDQADKHGRIPLSWAMEHANELLLRLLIEKGAAVRFVEYL